MYLLLVKITKEKLKHKVYLENTNGNAIRELSMKNQTKHIEITAIIICLLAMGILSLIGCKTYKPTDYMSWGDRNVENGAYDSAIRYYGWILDEFPSSPEAQIAREKIAAAKEKMKESIVTNVYAAAQRETLEDDFGFITEWDDNNIKVITKYISESKKGVRIPANMQIAKIEQQAFRRNENIIIVIIPDSVKSIGFWAFEGCTSLASVTIPDSVTSIDNQAFQNCTSLTSITIPKSVTKIEVGVFAGCTSLTSITIPNSVTSIGTAAFEGCTSLASVTIPDSVTSIGPKAFQNCTSLTSITIPKNITRIEKGVFAGCTSLTSITIPNSVTSIGAEAFSYSGLTSITIPSSVTRIEEGTFKNCYSLTSITIPNSVTEIGYKAFEDCVILGSVTIPSSITRIGTAAFYGCIYLESVTFQGKIASDKLGGVVTYSDWNYKTYTFDSPFPGDLREKYRANDGGPGTYIRIARNEKWRKQ